MAKCLHKYTSVISLRGEKIVRVICSDCGYTRDITKK